MPPPPTQPVAGGESAEQVRARVAATNQLLARSRQRANQAMAQVRHVDRLLHSPSHREAAAEQAEGVRLEHLVEAMEHEVETHLRAVALHEEAARLRAGHGCPRAG